jgi:hypothetical protein
MERTTNTYKVYLDSYARHARLDLGREDFDGDGDGDVILIGLRYSHTETPIAEAFYNRKTDEITAFELKDVLFDRRCNGDYCKHPKNREIINRMVKLCIEVLDYNEED